MASFLAVSATRWLNLDHVLGFQDDGTTLQAFVQAADPRQGNQGKPLGLTFTGTERATLLTYLSAYGYVDPALRGH